MRPTRCAYARDLLGARDGDFTVVEGGGGSALFSSRARIEVTPWSRF